MHYQPDWDEVDKADAEYRASWAEYLVDQRKDREMEAAWQAHELELQQQEGK